MISPNYTTPEAAGLPSGPRKVSLAVIHSTATAGIDSPLAWLCNPAAKASAHYLIDTNGAAYQLVDEANIAWHAGVSSWKGQEHRNSVNAFSIGIELVHPNDGRTPYDQRQVAALVALCAKIATERGLSVKDFVSHEDVAIPHGRKNDPKGFPWPVFVAALLRAGVPE